MSEKDIALSEALGIIRLKYHIQKKYYLDAVLIKNETGLLDALSQFLEPTKGFKDATNKQNSDFHRDNRITVWITDLPG